MNREGEVQCIPVVSELGALHHCSSSSLRESRLAKSLVFGVNMILGSAVEKMNTSFSPLNHSTTRVSQREH